MKKIYSILVVIVLYSIGIYLMWKFKEQGSITYIALIVAFLGQIVSILFQKDEGTDFNKVILEIKIENFIKNAEKYKSSLESYLKPLKENKINNTKGEYEYIENIRKSIYFKIYDLFDKNFKSYYSINNPVKKHEKEIKILLEIQDIFIDYEHVANNVSYSNINIENILDKYSKQEGNMFKDDISYINQIIEKAKAIS